MIDCNVQYCSCYKQGVQQGLPTNKGYTTTVNDWRRLKTMREVIASDSMTTHTSRALTWLHLCHLSWGQRGPTPLSPFVCHCHQQQGLTQEPVQAGRGERAGREREREGKIGWRENIVDVPRKHTRKCMHTHTHNCTLTNTNPHECVYAHTHARTHTPS